MAVAAGLSSEEQELAHTAALLHDIGKFVFPDSILKGNSRLTDEEYEIVKMHPFHGAQVLAQIEGYGPVANIVLAHHERIDGTGYPRALAGESIPLEGRILAVADAYEAMTADRPYRRALTTNEARAELRRGAGTQFDPRVVRAFERILDSR